MTTIINTNVRLTPLEERAKVITGYTREQILLKFRYRAITPKAETEHDYIHTVHNYTDIDYRVPKDRCVMVNGTIYCENAYYALNRCR